MSRLDVHGSKSLHPPDLRWRRGSIWLTAMLLLSIGPVEAASVRSIQRGNVTLGDGSPSVVVNLGTTVGLNTSFLIFGVSEDANEPRNGLIAGQITSPSTLRFERVGSSGTASIHWQVVEFQTAVTVQRGSVSLVGPPTDVTLTTPVDLNKSFPLITFRSDGATFDRSDFIRAELTSSTNLRLSVPSFDVTTIVEWQVIQYGDATVQSGIASFASGDLLKTPTVTAFDTSRSWLVYSYELLDNGGVPDIGQKLFHGSISNGTTLRFDRYNPGVDANLSWYLVEFTDATKVRYGSESFAIPSFQKNVPLAPAVQAFASIATGGGAYQLGGRSDFTGDDNPGVAWFTLEVTSGANLQITRGNASGNAEVGWFVIDFGIEPVQALAATATSGQNLVQWVNPAHGLYSKTMVLRRELPDCPAGPTDIAATLVADTAVGGPDGKHAVPDSGLMDGTTYCYAAYVDGDGSVTNLSTPVIVEARPFVTPAEVKWAYSAGGLSMSPPGARRQGPGASTIYAVSSNQILHAMEGGPSGGAWPASWKPYQLSNVSQHRPQVVPTAVGGATAGVFVSTTDGLVQAVDADTGTREWEMSIAPMVQAAPAGHLKFDTFLPDSTDLILIGTRDATGDNELVALDKDLGTPRWSFDNGGGGQAIGIVSGMAAVDYNLTTPLEPKVYFASEDHTVGGSSDNVWCLKFNASGPTLEWSTDLPTNIDKSPVLYGGTLYLADDAGGLYALNASTGIPLWGPEPTGDGNAKSFIFPRSGGQIFYATDNRVWSAIDDGSMLLPDWNSGASIANPSAPLFVRGTNAVIVGSGDGKLYQLDATSGAIVGQLDLGDPVAMVALGDASFDVANDMILIGSVTGIIYGISFPLP